MLTLILKLNHRKKCIQLLTFLLLFSLLISVGAACLRPQIVYASFAGTVAGYILTLFASFNTAITNPEVVTAINNTFGTMALEAADAGVIDQGIAAIAANTGFDMASIFSSTAAEATQVIEAAGITDAVAVAATAGENIAAGAGACAASATGSVLPAIGGLVLPAAGAIALGVMGGVLINHIRESIVNLVKNGLPLNTPTNIITDFPSNSTGGCYIPGKNGNIPYMGYVTGSQGVTFYSEDARNYYVSGLSGNQSSDYEYVVVIRQDGVLDKSQATRNYQRVNASTFDKTKYDAPSCPKFNTLDEGMNYYKNNHAAILKSSPDIVGLEGNQKGSFDGGTYNLTNVYPIYNYGDTVINYINPTDYQQFITNANYNTEIGDTGEETQGNLFDEFVNPYIKPVENPDIPDNPENPDIPDTEQRPTVPYPDPEEYPDAIPEVNPVPDTDIAPTAIPYPELPEPTDTEITETNDKITPFNLKNKFPFCLPFDIHKALLKLKGSREAPYFVWQIPFGDAGEQTVIVDMRAWDDVANILRLLELLLFIVGLAVATRNLIGGT